MEKYDGAMQATDGHIIELMFLDAA